MRAALLVLEDGSVFDGASFGAQGEAFGEVVFNTGMSGYQEVLTDPSYDGQIVTMTYPHIGNYGVNEEDVESSTVRVEGFVVRDVPVVWSSWRGRKSIDQYLDESNIVGITEVDTRKLTRIIRNVGAMRGAISTKELDPSKLLSRIREFPSIVGLDLVRNVSTTEPYQWPMSDGVSARYQVAAYDYGIKFNILRLLAQHGCAVTVYPASVPASEVLASSPDGVFLSNGPGDPEAVSYGIRACEELIGKVPVFGICLGHQLMALAAGFSTYKLRFGHRGINHPVARLADGAIEITTQNHGFAVAADAFGYEPPASPGAGLPDPSFADSDFGKIELTHLNLNDYTIEGLKFLDQPAFCVQYHPEAGPGPHDARYLFDAFIELMRGDSWPLREGVGGARASDPPR